MPDLAGWARVVAGLLRSGGRLYVRDGHPMLKTLNDGIDDEVGPPVASPEMYEWNHASSEIVQSVIDVGLRVTAFREHQECEWRALAHMVEGPDGRYRLREGHDRVPLMFTLEARVDGAR